MRAEHLARRVGRLEHGRDLSADDPSAIDEEAFSAAWGSLPREDRRVVLDYWRGGAPEDRRAAVGPILERLHEGYRARGGRGWP